MFQNGPSIELSPIGPTNFLLQITMSGSGSSGNEIWAAAMMSSAFLESSLRTWSSRLESTVCSNGSSVGKFTRYQLFPELPLAAVGMFLEQKRLHSPGVGDVSWLANSEIW